MRPGPHRLPVALLAILVAVATTGCQPRPELRARDVEGRIEAFLDAVRTGKDVFGWNLLRDDVRAAYPGGSQAWVEAITMADARGLSWTILEVTVDDFGGCADVDFGRVRDAVPFTLYDDGLPPKARVAATLERGPLHLCATIGPFPWDTGVHGVG